MNFRAKVSLFSAWFYQQNEFKTEFESMEVNETNKYLSFKRKVLLKVLRFSEEKRQQF